MNRIIPTLSLLLSNATNVTASAMASNDANLASYVNQTLHISQALNYWVGRIAFDAILLQNSTFWEVIDAATRSSSSTDTLLENIVGADLGSLSTDSTVITAVSSVEAAISVARLTARLFNGRTFYTALQSAKDVAKKLKNAAYDVNNAQKVLGSF